VSIFCSNENPWPHFSVTGALSRGLSSLAIDIFHSVIALVEVIPKITGAIPPVIPHLSSVFFQSVTSEGKHFVASRT
jgi:hypothetical protein